MSHIPINITPLIPFKMTSVTGFLRRFSLNFDANNAKHEHYIKKTVAKFRSRNKKDSVLFI